MNSAVYDIVNDRIINALEQGVIPWRRTWKPRAGPDLPTSMVTGKAYRGINVWVLGATAAIMGYDSGLWLTYNQSKKFGGHVKKGEKATPVVFWKFLDVNKNDGSIDTVPMLRYFSAFALEQCEDIELPKRFQFEPVSTEPVAPLPVWEQIVGGYKDRPHFKFQGSQPMYRPSTDTVIMPVPESFDDPKSFVFTGLHELVHSTGHKSRLGRLEKTSRFGSGSYSKEELVAELGASYLSAITNIETPKIAENAAAYINSWIAKIRDKDNKRLVVSAGGQAQKAVDRILGTVPESEASI